MAQSNFEKLKAAGIIHGEISQDFENQINELAPEEVDAIISVDSQLQSSSKPGRVGVAECDTGSDILPAVGY